MGSVFSDSSARTSPSTARISAGGCPARATVTDPPAVSAISSSTVAIISSPRLAATSWSSRRSASAGECPSAVYARRALRSSPILAAAGVP